MSRVVMQSLQTFGGERCVDIYRRADKTFGSEEYRRDPECAGGWFVTGGFGGGVFETDRDALASARTQVPWLNDLLDNVMDQRKTS